MEALWGGGGILWVVLGKYLGSTAEEHLETSIVGELVRYCGSRGEVLRVWWNNAGVL